MKKVVATIAAMCLAASILVGCGNDMQRGNRVYKTYGLLNEDNEKSENVKYNTIWGNVIWGALLVETIIAPIYFFGFSMFEPVAIKSPEEVHSKN